MLRVSKARTDLIRQLARAGGRHWFHRWPKLGEWLALLFVPFISKEIKRLGALEKTQPGTVLTEDAKRGLRAYIEGPLARQISEEYKKQRQAQTTFVFGHTHKPFSASMKFDHFPDPLSVYNSGGWVVDTADTEPAHGGAIVLADEVLNVVSVRMYNEAKKQRRPTVNVEAVDGSENPLYEHVSRLVRCDQDPWLSFSRVVAENVEIYHKRFRDRLDMVR